MALRRSASDSRESAIESRRSPVAIAESLSHRVVIEEIQPDIDGGRFPIKRTVGESVDVTATIFADGHDVIAAVLRDRTTTIDAEHAESAEHAEHLEPTGSFSAHSASSANSAFPGRGR